MVYIRRTGIGGAVAEGTYAVNVRAYGAACDARSVSDVATTSGSAVITSATAAFGPADVGKVASLRAGGTGVTTSILSVQSSSQATLAANAPSTGTGRILTFGTDDTSAIQDAIDDCPRAGTVFHPAAESLISAALCLPEDVTLRGGGVAENTTGVIASSYGSGPSVPPYLDGAVITQVTAGADVLSLPGTGKNVHLHDIGLKFAPAIMFLDTGHGVRAVPTASYLSGHENGLFNPRWDNVVVFGHDGDHYAFYLLNSNLGTFAHLRSHGGGGVYYESDSYGAPFGNAAFIHPFVRMFCGGTANGYTLKSRLIEAGVPSLNLLTFVRPQCNILQPTLAPAFSGLGIDAPTIAQYNWRNIGVDGAGSYPGHVDVIDPNLENDGANNFPNDFGGMYSGTIVRNGGLIVVPPVNGYSTENRQNPGVPLQPTLVAGPALGTGPTVQVLEGNDQGGVLLLQTGSSPGAAQGVAVTVTCPSMPPTGIKSVHVQGYAYSAGWVTWYVDDIVDNSKSFTIRSWQGPLTADYPYQVVFTVIPRNTPNNTV